jgi:hypothetical protein
VPKENTHLYFAHRVIEQTEQKEWQRIVNGNLQAFYLGSVMPDAFYYSPKARVREVSEILHGRHGERTNIMIFDLLDLAKARASETDLAFVFGYLTHAALDITFHPLIYFLSGNYFDEDENRRYEAMYLHRHFETFLDRKVNENFFFHDLIRLKIIKKLGFPEILKEKFDVKKAETAELLIRKNLISLMENSRLAYYFLYTLFKIGVKTAKLFYGLSYANLKADKRIIPDLVDYKDVITGHPKRELITDLFDRADDLASVYFEAAYAYYRGKIGREEAERFIRGESFNTGRIGVPVTAIKYTYNSMNNEQ